MLGYPRIGRRRELKKALEAFWAGRTAADELEATAADLRERTRDAPRRARPRRTDSAIPEASRSTTRCSTPPSPSAPCRPASRDVVGRRRRVDLAGYFTVARGDGDDAAARDDQVVRHQLPLPGARDRPGDRRSARASDRLVREFAEAKADGFLTRPVIVGPVTYLALAKADARTRRRASRPIDRLDGPAARLRRAARGARRGGCHMGAARRARARRATRSRSRRAAARRRDAAYRALGAGLTGRARRSSSRRPTATSTRRCPVLAATAVEAIGIDLVRGRAPRRAGARPGDQDAGRRRDRRPQHLARGPRRRVRRSSSSSRGSAPRRSRSAPRRRCCTCRTTSTDEPRLDADAEELARVRRPEGRRGRHARRGSGRGPRGHPRASCRRHRRRDRAARARRRRRRGPRPRRRPRPRPTSAAAPYAEREAAQDARARPAAAADDDDRLVPADRRDPHAPRAALGKGELDRGAVRRAR